MKVLLKPHLFKNGKSYHISAPQEPFNVSHCSYNKIKPPYWNLQNLVCFWLFHLSKLIFKILFLLFLLSSHTDFISVSEFCQILFFLPQGTKSKFCLPRHFFS